MSCLSLIDPKRLLPCCRTKKKRLPSSTTTADLLLVVASFFFFRLCVFCCCFFTFFFLFSCFFVFFFSISYWFRFVLFSFFFSCFFLVLSKCGGETFCSCLLLLTPSTDITIARTRPACVCNQTGRYASLRGCMVPPCLPWLVITMDTTDRFLWSENGRPLRLRGGRGVGVIFSPPPEN